MPINVLETRGLTVELSESDWLGLRSLERDPVAYLKAQSRQRFGGEDSQMVGRSPAYSETDE